MALGEGLEQPGQQVDRHAQPGANAHLPHLQPVELGGLAEQLLVLLADRPDGGQEGLPLGGQAHAEPVPGQELQTQLVLQSGDDVADGRLGVTQNLRSLGKAAQVCGLQQDFVFLNAHRQSPPQWGVFPQYTIECPPCPGGSMKGFEIEF